MGEGDGIADLAKDEQQTVQAIFLPSLPLFNSGWRWRALGFGMARRSDAIHPRAPFSTASPAPRRGGGLALSV